MKYFIPVLTLLLSFIISCKSFDNELLTNRESIDKNIEPMHVIVNYESINTCFSPSYDPAVDLNNEDYISIIKNNLKFQNNSHNYYLSIITRKVVSTENFIGIPLTVLTGLTYAIFGGPTLIVSYSVHLSAAIMSTDDKVLKTYEAKGTDTEYMAFYWGTGYPQKNSCVKAITFACKDLRTQLKNDVNNINKLVK